MKTLPLIVFFMLLLMTVTSSVVSYDRTRRGLDRDLNRALSLTIQSKGYEQMKQDSIRAYRLLSPSLATGQKVLTIEDPTFQQYIQTEALRPKAFIAYHITPREGGYDVEIAGQAHCSMAFVWGMSDQRLSLLFGLATLLSLFFCVRRRTVELEAQQLPSPHLTPMQDQLMEMFLKAPDHRLTKREICDALWPNKENAPESLYTLIRRFKNVLAESAVWEIVSERGKWYELKRKQSS